MGLLEAFLLGAAAGGVAFLVAWILFTRDLKGRSVARFALPGWTANQVLQIVYGYAAAQRMHVEPGGIGLLARAGSEWVTGVRVIEVQARDTANGCEVAIEAYLRSFYPKEVHLDPSKLFGIVPRRQALRLAQGLLDALGAPAVPFEHRRAA